MIDARRVRKEIVECSSDKDGSGITASPVEDSLQYFVGYIKGPEDSPYQGGKFKLDIKLPDDYPFAPPKIKFHTRVWHPNVSSVTGAICLDVLTTEWSPAFTIRTTLISISALLTSPEPNNPQDAIVAHQYKTKPDEFYEKAASWTQTYAK